MFFFWIMFLWLNLHFYLCVYVCDRVLLCITGCYKTHFMAKPRLAWNLQQTFCLSLPRASIAGVRHRACLLLFLFGWHFLALPLVAGLVADGCLSSAWTLSAPPCEHSLSLAVVSSLMSVPGVAPCLNSFIHGAYPCANCKFAPFPLSTA